MKTLLMPAQLQILREIDPRLFSYNIEMAEVTGGTFWKEYTSAEIAGTEAFPAVTNPEDTAALMQVYPPIDLYNPKLRYLASQFGPVWIRVSGTWATKTYYDLDDQTDGKVPAGFQNILTGKQWRGVLDFVKAMNASLLTSMANCPGIHKADEPWNADLASRLFAFSQNYGVPVSACEFMNEPNFLTMSGAPAGYTPADYVRDANIFFQFLDKNYPDCLKVGPGCMDVSPLAGPGFDLSQVPGVPSFFAGLKEKLNVYSYHCYNGASQRMGTLGHCWPADEALSNAYLDVAPDACKWEIQYRNEFCPGAPMWVTESADAAGGGTTWASTYLDVFRMLNNLGSFAQLTNGIIFHNTLCASDYGLLDQQTYEPRPDYFACLLWNRLMGTTVYSPELTNENGLRFFAHSRKDGQPGCTWLVINTAEKPQEITLPASAEAYILTAKTLRNETMLLNGSELKLDEAGKLPAMAPEVKPAGTCQLPAYSCSFLVL